VKFLFRYTARFMKSAAAIFSEDDLLALEIYLANHSDAGDVISGGGGLRKLRFGAKGRGKRGGARVIYLRVVDQSLIVLADCYAKNAKENLSGSDLEALDRESHD